MKFQQTTIEGVWLILPERFSDDRGYFARTFCVDEFAAQGLHTTYVQSSVSQNRLRGTLRGMHWQQPPHQEVKLIRCSRGAVCDMILDLRQESSTFGKWQAFDLSADNGASVYAPAGVAHGFQTLADDTEVVYQISQPFAPQAAAGLRWNDPVFNLQWPLPVSVISQRDRTYPDYQLPI